MENYFECLLKSSIFDRKRKLLINKDFIEFEDNDLANRKNSKFLKEEIESFRFGVKWINGYKFTIGRNYCIDIKNSNGKIIKLRLKSIYGVRKSELHKKYASIINNLMDIHFMDIGNKYINLHKSNEEFTLLSVKFLEGGVQLKNKKIILWEDLATKEYNNKFILFSKTNTNIYSIFEYATDWNTSVLLTVIEQILIEKKKAPL